MMTFIDMVLSQDAEPTEIDDFIQRWHDGDDTRPLPAALGMSDDEYALWVEEPEALELIFKARTAGMRLQRAGALAASEA